MEQLSFFENYPNNKTAKSKLPIILSASRMTDMPKFYPNELIEEVNKRIAKNINIHTLVLWSKHPSALLNPILKDYLQYLMDKNIQIYFQCTITGMGGTLFEPNSPHTTKALNDLNSVIELIGTPRRVRMRIDPLIKVKNVNTGEFYSNIPLLEQIIIKASRLDISTFSTSFLEKGLHKKVDKRLNELGWTIESPNADDRLRVAKWLNKIASKYNVSIAACSVPGLPESRCIDGYLLKELHPLNLDTRLDEPRHRKLCGCTYSIDIGGWPPKKCYTGCQYCYANASYVNSNL